MNLRLSSWSKLVLVLAVAGASVLVSDMAQASNMGFKLNKVISPTITPTANFENWVALPYRNPYNNAQDLCNALGLSSVAPKGNIKVFDPQTGIPSSHNCGDLGAFLLSKPYTQGGFIVRNTTPAGGILVGSHAGSPPAPLSLYPLIVPLPKGQNYMSVPYHTTSVDAQALCVDLGLPAGGKVQRRDAATGVPGSHNCGDLGAFNLSLGEAVLITFPNSAGFNPLVVSAGHPAHF